MSALVVDTSSWISYFEGQPSEAIDEALLEGRVYLPPVVAAELISGKMPEKSRLQLEAFLRELPICGSDLSHWIRVGSLRRKLASKGLTVSTPDAHVAQCALDLNGHLISGDRVFAAIAAKVDLRLN